MDEASRDPTDSPALSVAGYLYGISFGAVFMAVGLAIVAGLTQNLEARWQKFLQEDGYGTPEQLRVDRVDRAAFGPALSSWKARAAARVELARTTLPAEVLADDARFSTALDALREKADDWEPNEPGDPLKPLPEKTWDRFAALTTSQRVALFKGLLVGPVFFLPGLARYFGRL